MTGTFPNTGNIKLAVVTGKHTFDVLALRKMFDDMPGVDTWIQHMENWVTTPREVRESYDVVLFYNLHMETPSGVEEWWEAGYKQSMEELGATKQGIFVLHHALLAWPDWQLWNDVVGIDDRSFQYFDEQPLKIDIANPDHPITNGLQSWEMVDEPYIVQEPGEGSEILLTIDHPKSMKAIGWVRHYKNSPVFCLELGHGPIAYSYPQFQDVLLRGIKWLAGK